MCRRRENCSQIRSGWHHVGLRSHTGSSPPFSCCFGRCRHSHTSAVIHQGRGKGLAAGRQQRGTGLERSRDTSRRLVSAIDRPPAPMAGGEEVGWRGRKRGGVLREAGVEDAMAGNGKQRRTTGAASKGPVRAAGGRRRAALLLFFSLVAPRSLSEKNREEASEAQL